VDATVSVCANCPAGKFGPITGSASCTKCPAGKFTDVPQSTECKECPFGKSTDGESGRNACSSVPDPTPNPTPSPKARAPPAPSVSACRCERSGLLAEHLIGLVLLTLLLPVGLDSFCRGDFAESYRPGSAAYFARTWVLEVLDMGCVLVVFSTPGTDRSLLILPIAGNALAIALSSFWIVQGWSDARKRRRLGAAVDEMAQNHAGEGHVSEELERAVADHNATVTKRFTDMKQSYSIFFGMEIGDLSFVVTQYIFFCDATACSFSAQLATIVSAGMLCGSVRDLLTMRRCSSSPLAISLEAAAAKSREHGASATPAPKPVVPEAAAAATQNPASAPADPHLSPEQLQRYQHVRGLLAAVVREAGAAAYVYGNPHISTSPMSLEIHELNMRPADDVRADAVVLANVCARACWRAAAAAVDGEPLSASALHVLDAVVSSVSQQIDGFTDRRRLELAIELLQRAASCLPPSARTAVEAEMQRWNECKQPGSLSRWAPRVVSGAGSAWDGV
jgi:hypothetical protein